jgi:uncharacterized protein (DUF952 family)
MADSIIYKITPRGAWEEAERTGRFAGSPVDRADGFIHFSTASQVRETAERHYAGKTDLLLLAVRADTLGAALKWEPSRGGDLFPHLYGDLLIGSVAWARPLPLSPGGPHEFPPLDGEA